MSTNKRKSSIRFSAISDYDGLVQDSSNSSANALELLQSCTKPLMIAYYVLQPRPSQQRE